MTWSCALADERVQREFDALPADMRARFERTVRLVQAVGLERVHEPYVIWKTGYGKCV